MQKIILAFFFLFGIFFLKPSFSQTYYVATDGNDNTGTGTLLNPWATITHALDNAADGSTIIVKPGTYFGRVRMRGSFPQGVLVKSEIPYLAKLRNNDRVMTFYTHPDGVNGITIEGFDIAHDELGASPLVIHIDGNGQGDVHDITIQNCILHDSYDNDILKINNSCFNIKVQGNLFFNQTGSDEHIDGNSIRNLVIQDNVFMNDFAASGRVNQNNTSSYIVIKDSSTSDMYTGTRDVLISRNVFLNYEGSTGHNFVLLGEDGMSYYEAFDVMIENNLMLGNSSNTMRAPFGVKGCKGATFRNNTVVGDFPSLAFAFRLNTEGSNMANDSIFLYNNIWSDPTATMEDFSDTPFGETDHFEIYNNVYWNGGNAIPVNAGSDMINIDDDANAITGNPQLTNQSGIIPPHFNSTNNEFADGSMNIRAAFEGLISVYGTLGPTSAAIDNAAPANSPAEDILGNPRGNNPDIGAVERNPVTGISVLPSAPGVLLSPNPVNDLLTVSMKSDYIGELRINVLTIDGELVHSEIRKKNRFSFESGIDFSKVINGVYIINIQGENRSLWSGKVIRE